ncbi:MAG: COX15/CtaA family protein [Bacteroidota bacterium]
MDSKKDKNFIRIVTITIVLTYLVILAGTVVRTTQSGMGCPDWPKCFGQWVPPTDESQLPANYQEIYAHRGYADTTFSAYHTWVEYVNRLLGVLVGLSIFATVLASFRYWKTDKLVVFLSFISFVLVGFQGWLGALVVASNLAPIKITTHMLVALLLVALLIYILYRVKFKGKQETIFENKIKYVLYIVIILSIIQVIFGTQVRQEIDVIAKQNNFLLRETWIDSLSSIFLVHRSFSILVFAANVMLIYNVIKSKIASSKIISTLKWVGIVLFIEILSGIVLAYFSVPKAMQPTHLLFASILFGIQFYLFLQLFFSKAVKSA